MYLLASGVAFEKVVLDIFALGVDVKLAIEAVFELAHEKIARIDLTIDSHLRVRHQ